MHAWPLILAAGLGAGFVNAIAGGGTLLSFPALLYAGLSPVCANATNTLALWPGSLAGTWAYRRRLAPQHRQIWLLALPSLLGGLLGAWILLNTPERAFRFVVPYLILLACGLLLANEPVGRWMTRRLAARPHHAAASLWLAQLFIALYGGYFGAGIGILMLAAMAILLPENLQSANALKNLLATLINGAALLYFVVSRTADLPVAGLMTGAAILGGYTGAHVAQRFSPRLLRLVVVVYGVVVAVDLLRRQ